jgi:hypothetical protein
MTLEEIEKKLDELNVLEDDAFALPTITQYQDECERIWGLKKPLLFERNKLTEITFEDEIPEYGDLMTLEVFINCCNSGGFIDYDGGGKYANSTHMSNISVSPSMITSGYVMKDPRLTHVIWFNR